MTVKVLAPKSFMNLKADNPFYELVEEVVIRQAPRRSVEGGLMEIEVEDTSSLTPESIAGILAVGGDILDFQVFFEIQDYDDEVPEGIPNRTSTDDEGNTSVLTWREWDSDSPSYITRGDRKFVNSKSFNHQFIPLSELQGVDYLLSLPEEE